MPKKRKLTTKEEAKIFSTGVRKIQKKFNGDIKKQSIAVDKLHREIKKARVDKNTSVVKERNNILNKRLNRILNKMSKR